MKFLIIGLGSMGKRRIRNLKHLGYDDIIGFDLSKDRRIETEEKYNIFSFSSLDEALIQKPDAVVISTPPFAHYDLAITIAEKGLPFFMEANVIPDGFEDVVKKCKELKIFYAPSCTLRFNPSLKIIHKLVKEHRIGNILEFIYHSGQYLPDWHPFEDYRKFYVSKKQSGACREIVPFELTWLTWTFGNVKKLTSFKRKISKLETDIDDIYTVLLEFKTGLIGTFVVDVLSRVAYRTLRIIGEEGVIEWDWTSKKIRIFSSSNKTWEEIIEPLGIKTDGYVAEEDMYIDEMQAFVDGIKNPSNYSNTPEDESYVLNLLKKIEESSDNNTQILIEH